MDTILTKMHVGDLHPENCIYRIQKGKKETVEEIVPIDLEVIQSGGSLLGTKANHPLTSQEEQLIEEFNNHVKLRPYRSLPMATEELAGYLSACCSGSKTADGVTEELVKEFQTNYNYLLKKEIKTAFLQDVLNRDVPYFTELDGELYYGLSSQGVKIGELKEGK